MNEAMEVLYNRRSIRRYKSEQISREELDAVIRAGLCAASGKNGQSAIIVAVQDKETRDALAALNTKIAGRPADCYYGAPTLIFVLAPDDGFGVLDACAVETNMLNAAYACGLGSCWIHRANKMFKTPEGKEYLRKWGLDENLDGWCSIALGYADMDAPAPKARKADYYRIIK